MPGPGGCESEGLDLNSERARESKERAYTLVLENAHRRGELCLVEDVESTWVTIVGRVKTKLMGIPSKLSALIDEPDERRRIFIETKSIVDGALSEIARGTDDPDRDG